MGERSWAAVSYVPAGEGGEAGMFDVDDDSYFPSLPSLLPWQRQPGAVARMRNARFQVRETSQMPAVLLAEEAGALPMVLLCH